MSMNPAEWRKAHSETFFLDPHEPDPLAGFLSRAGVLSDGEVLRTAGRAGEGQINCTLRVTTDQRSLIVKQARPWVEKYPQFEAPWDRAVREIEFYELASTRPAVARMMPRLLHADARARLIVLEDVGAGADYTDLYSGARISEGEVDALADFLNDLHHGFLEEKNHRGLAIREMRELNARHIFFIPLRNENGLDLDAITPGLQSEANALKGNREYVTAVSDLAEVYRADGGSLVHGDFFPGSFLRTSEGPRVIDPEFGYFGRPVFDSGVLVAHLCLARQEPAVVDRFFARYAPPAGYEEGVALRLAGVEIMRRVIGYAQLHLRADLEEKKRLLRLSHRLVMDPDRRWLA